MGRTVMDGEGKSHILFWRHENVTIKDICKRTGRTKSSIWHYMLLLVDCPRCCSCFKTKNVKERHLHAHILLINEN